MSEPVNWVPLLRVESLTCDKNSTLSSTHSPLNTPFPHPCHIDKVNKGENTHTHTHAHTLCEMRSERKERPTQSSAVLSLIHSTLNNLLFTPANNNNNKNKSNSNKVGYNRHIYQLKLLPSRLSRWPAA